jgi:tight adherence protein B
MALFIAALVFLAVVSLLVGIWWALERGQRMRARLETGSRGGRQTATEILLVDEGDTDSALRDQLGQLAFYKRLGTLREQAGHEGPASRLAVLIGGCALAGFALGWLRTGGAGWGLLAAVIAASLPVVFLFYKRHQRLQRFEQMFPDALEMMSRSMRAGNAFTGSIQLVGSEMPNPVGQEFKRVSEEIRFGLDPGEALTGLQRRVPTEDTGFFCAAIRIQRSSGGNLAEILDRLSDVIRKRAELLSHARVLSAQHKWAAICVGLSPVIFSLLFQLMSPGYFDPLLNSSIGPPLILVGLTLEAIGFLMIWRISQIKV